MNPNWAYSHASCIDFISATRHMQQFVLYFSNFPGSGNLVLHEPNLQYSSNNFRLLYSLELVSVVEKKQIL